MDKQCAACGKEEEGHLFECPHCCIARYCTKVCRKAHWKEHQQHCKVYKEDCDDQYGKHLVARRDLKPGEIILQEVPLVLAFDEIDDVAALLCVGCCSTLNGDLAGAMRCPECNWPMCGQNKCWAEGSAHSLGECVLLKAAGCRVTIDDITNHQSSLNNVYYAIMTLRCLSLLLRDPQEWEKLMGLGKDSKLFGKSSIELEEAGVRGTVDVDAVLELLKRWIPFSANTASKETVGKLCRLFFDHGVTIRGFQGVNHASACAVYSVASLIVHSCVANASMTFTKDEGQIVVRTAVPIAKGARISLNHLKAILYDGTFRRRNYLRKFKSKLVNSFCSCDRCKDPSELGTYVSGVYCSECPANDDAGILLPKDPLDDNSAWICNKCPAVNKTMTEFHKTVAEEFRARSWTELEDFIGRYSKILHPHHFFLINVKNTLLEHYFIMAENEIMTSELLDKMVPLVHDVFEIVDVLSPGLNCLRGHYLDRLSRVMRWQISRLQHRNRVHLASNNSNMELYASELTSLVKARKKILKELLIYLSLEDTDEGMAKSNFYKGAIVDFIQIDRLLQKVKLN